LVKGFIDLVFERDGRFFLVDWKSNRLGSDTSAYSHPALQAAMARHHYTLQYHLYTVALHRYLRLRLGARYDYAQHFGGIFYLFLRGIDPADPGLGIFHDRPPRERIEQIDAHFARS
jgi:exodeoxyribonuclease V beta subunit